MLDDGRPGRRSDDEQQPFRDGDQASEVEELALRGEAGHRARLARGETAGVLRQLALEEGLAVGALDGEDSRVAETVAEGEQRRRVVVRRVRVRILHVRLAMGAQRIIGALSTPEDRPELHVIDIFMMSVKCGNCDTYQTIVKFRKGAEKNVYTYECENEICDPNVTRTFLEVPTHLDNSTRRAEELPYYTSDAAPEPPE